MLEVLAEKELAPNKIVKEAFCPVFLLTVLVLFPSLTGIATTLTFNCSNSLSFLFYNKIPFQSSKEKTV